MIPRATIRLQFNRHFTLDDATAIVPYLASLGLSHIYASPLFAACHGSSHGYDVVDPNQINPELGGEAAFRRLANKLASYHMGLILDIVPNHMAASHENPWWFDVLEFGAKSRFAKFFDINWRSSDPALRNKLLLPILGADLSACLAAGEIDLIFDTERQHFAFRYYDHILPLAPASYRQILKSITVATPLLNASWLSMPSLGPEQLAERKDDLAALYTAHRPAVDTALNTFRQVGARRGDAMLRLLSAQHYVLAPWTDAATQINWRRFFDISGLVALRMERTEVFSASHELVVKLFREGLIDGVRLDHVDGLADPKAYCRRLRRDLKRVSGKRPGGQCDPYIVVEKILDSQESLPADWQVEGTTGYDFMNDVAGIFHDPRGEAALTELWTATSGDSRDFSTIAQAARIEILDRLFPRQFEDLVQCTILAARLRPTSATSESVRSALSQLLSVFTRYRLYGDKEGLPTDQRAVLSAYQRQASFSLSIRDQEMLETLCHTLWNQDRRNIHSLESRIPFQQLSATLAAKAVEDTAFYRYGRILSRTDVGSNPGQFHIPVDEFHNFNQHRQKSSPNGLLTTATHDHKRGEDTRARLMVLSEDADRWSELVRSWIQRHQADHHAVHSHVKLMIYQGVIGSWPFDLKASDAPALHDYKGRLKLWLQKALREAKQETSWQCPNTAYEEACHNFLDGLFDPQRSEFFLTDAQSYVDHIAAAGALNGLAQMTLRLTSPGIPDLYQGCEFWDLSLVDPDNRHEVDYPLRHRALDQSASILDLLSTWQDGHVKQRLLQKLLELRNDHTSLFQHGRYLPLALSGPAADRLIAFARLYEDESLIVLVPRLCFSIIGSKTIPKIPTASWRDTMVYLPQMIEAESFIDHVTGRPCNPKGSVLPVEQILEQFPISVLHQKKQ